MSSKLLGLRLLLFDVEKATLPEPVQALVSDV
jgi:hypothetical protein